MRLITIKYSSSYKEKWDDFLDKSKNSTFLFKRDFLEYHSDRFLDYSVMVFDGDELCALLPACLENINTINSHGGLTYGGLVVLEDIKLNSYLKIFSSILYFLNSEGIYQLKYKAIPAFYTKIATQEEDYASFILRAENFRTDTSLAINRSKSIPYQNRRLRCIKKANSFNLIVKEDNNFDVFWESILSPNLLKKFNKSPTHSLSEIKYLAHKFPNNIKQFNVYKDNDIVAGCCIFVTETVAHAQYISSNDLGRNMDAIDLLFDYLIKDRFKTKEYFDFGICNENEGLSLNHGLLDWKEGFGGRTYAHKFYLIQTINYKLIQKITIN